MKNSNSNTLEDKKDRLLPSETPEYKEAEDICHKYARQLSDQLLVRLNHTIFEPEITNTIRYPRQLVLEKIVKLLTDQI